jgi:hypothetical protein
MRLLMVLLAGLALLAAVPAGASTITFAGAPYSSWHPGPHSYTTTFDGIGLTISAWNTRGHWRRLGYKDETHQGVRAVGIGVHGGHAGGEIGRGEELRFTFDQPVLLTSFTTNFQYWEYTNRPPHTRFFEGGKYRLFDGVSWGSWVDFSQTDYLQTYPNPFTPGQVTVAFGSGVQVWGLAIRASGLRDHDFTVHSLSAQAANAVPEPGTLLLMAGPLLGLVAWRRRRTEA